MEIFLPTLVILLLSIAGLALGVMAGRPPIKGSCGGLSCIKSGACAGCRHREGAERL
jgi:hypothetical protein